MRAPEAPVFVVPATLGERERRVRLRVIQVWQWKRKVCCSYEAWVGANTEDDESRYCGLCGGVNGGSAGVFRSRFLSKLMSLN